MEKYIDVAIDKCKRYVWIHKKVSVKLVINDQNYEWKEWIGTYVRYAKNECVEFAVHSCE